MIEPIRTLRALTFGRLRLAASREPIAAFGSGPSVTAPPRHLPQRVVGEFLVKRLSLKILPELVSGRGTAGRSPVVDGPPLAADLWRGKHSLRSCPSVTCFACDTSPRQAQGGLNEVAYV
jgi:hypothetical protein